jgi:hypothetical protein
MHEDADTTSTAAPAIPRVALDAYPRLCGLPVTIERLVPATSVPASAPAPAQRAAPARSARAKRRVARTVVVMVVAAATILAVAAEARAQAPAPGAQVASS